MLYGREDATTDARGSAVEQVYSYVFHKIQAREFAPGTRINIEELSREFGVSRTPIREALSRLAQDGFVEQKYNAGMRVAEFSSDAMFETIEANTKLFNLIFDDFSEHGIEADMVEELREILQTQHQADQANDMEMFHAASMDFHQAIIKRCKNGVIRAYTSTTQKQINLCSMIYQLELEHRQRSLEEHGKIAEFLAAGEIQNAKACMEAHNLYPVQALRESAGVQAGNR